MKRQRRTRIPGQVGRWSRATVPVPKKYTQGYINVGPTPNREMLGQYRDKVLIPDPWLETLFHSHMPSMAALVKKWMFVPPRLVSHGSNSDEGLGPYYIEESGRYADYPIKEKVDEPVERDDCPPFVRAYIKYLGIIAGAELKRCITLHSNATETWLLYHQDNTHWIVMKDSVLKEMKRSHTFSSSRMAIYAFKRRHIHWLISLSSSELPKED